jgi:hypothetical protein
MQPKYSAVPYVMERHNAAGILHCMLFGSGTKHSIAHVGFSIACYGEAEGIRDFLLCRKITQPVFSFVCYG